MARRPDGERGAYPGGASLLAGGDGWVLVEDAPERALGGALAWGRKHGVRALHVVVDSPEAAGVLARRAAAFTVPPSVWVATGTFLEPAVAAPPAEQAPLSADDAALAPSIVEAGAEPVVEHGVLRGEVLGLEVCRVVGGRLEVGMGKHDREAQLLVHGGRPSVEVLADAVRAVREVRTADGPPHEMRRLAAERWLRAVVCRRPELVGCSRLEPVPPPVPRGDLRLPAPAPAVGEGVVAVCSVGVDTDLVPTAADARLVHGPDSRLLLVVPEQDDHPLTRALAASLAQPAEVVTVPDDWRHFALCS
ncbi:MAG TPA: hypothetical protein VHF47_07835 [Acidimicrobiales bacterium]|nr:hypothetical protein [Acidimicrobiales bacterium]